ncbi:MAG: hypothetical protein J7647_27265 [Cyanobacteria bacterium SBLK]|nr:hypothetical protein [Cyanobacteria bacterium SBLK]
MPLPRFPHPYFPATATDRDILRPSLPRLPKPSHLPRQSDRDRLFCHGAFVLSSFSRFSLIG